MSALLQNRKLQLGIIIAATLLAYGNIFSNQFVWDDRDFILGWPAIQSTSNVPELLAGELPARHGGVYRPVRSLLYVGAYALFGENVMGYHALSLAVHLAATILVYLITKKIANKSSIAFFTALLFGVHPVHTEAVTYITTNFDLWGIVLLLAAIFAYLRSTETNTWHWRTAALVLGGLAMFTYEIALVLPVLILGYERLYRKQRWPQIAKIVLPYAAVAAAYFVVRLLLITTPERAAPLLGGSVQLHILTIIKILAQYVIITVWPVNLNIYPPLTPAQSITDATVLIATALLATIAIAAVVAYRRKQVIVTWSILLFFITLLPVIHIVPSKIILVERYLYLPTFGFCLISAWLLTWISEQKKPAGTYLAAGLLIVIVGAYTTTTLRRNGDWRDETTLWTKTVAQVPRDARAQHNFGVVKYLQGDYQSAIAALQQSISLDPGYVTSYNSLGQVYTATEQYDLAIVAYQQALTLEPQYLDAVRNLGDAYLTKENFSAAVRQYDQYLASDPTDATVYSNRALAYLNAGQLEAAERDFTTALRLHPTLLEAKLGLAITLMVRQQYPRAKALLNEVLATDPQHAVAKEKLNLVNQLMLGK